MKSQVQDTGRQALASRPSFPQSCQAEWLRMGRGSSEHCVVRVKRRLASGRQWRVQITVLGGARGYWERPTPFCCGPVLSDKGSQQD